MRFQLAKMGRSMLCPYKSDSNPRPTLKKRGWGTQSQEKSQTQDPGKKPNLGHPNPTEKQTQEKAAASRRTPKATRPGVLLRSGLWRALKDDLARREFRRHENGCVRLRPPASLRRKFPGRPGRACGTRWTFRR